MTIEEPTPKHDKRYEICGAIGRQRHEPCLRPAGWGTSHPGFGKCKLHGGTNQNTNLMQIEAAAKTFGLPIKVSAAQALEEELWRTAGHVAWLGAVVARLEPVVSQASPLPNRSPGADPGANGGGLTTDPEGVPLVETEGLFDWVRTNNGTLFRQPSVWIQMYENERKHLVKVSSELVRLGVDRERLNMIRSSGVQMIAVFQSVLGDARLGLTQEQKAAVPELIREHIAARQIEQ